MSKYAIRRGHQRTGADGCAEDIINEIDVANAYYEHIINGLKSQGHEVLDVTPPEAYRSLSNSLMYSINMANNWGADFFISCHANSCDRTSNPVGCEVLYYNSSARGLALATSVDSQIASLGFRDRGAKADVRGLAEFKYTQMTTIIIEPFFISSQADVDLFNNIGAATLGNAIVKGITVEAINTTKLGWNLDSKGWWYCTDLENGYYYTSENGWQLINEEYYIFNARGYAIQSNWYYSASDKKWYYLDKDCKMVKSKWEWIDSACYCFNENGVMYADCTTPDGYKVDKTGAWVK